MITDTLLPTLMPFVVIPPPAHICRAIIPYVPPPERSITTAADRRLDEEWIQVYQIRVPEDTSERCYLADWMDLGCTLKELMRFGQYRMLQLRLVHVRRSTYESIVGSERSSFADCG